MKEQTKDEVTISSEKMPCSHMRVLTSVSAAKMMDLGEQAISGLTSEVTVPGFRQGKAPKGLVLEKIGKDSIRKRIIDLAMPLVIDKILSMGLRPIEAPGANITKMKEGEPLELTLEFDVWPDISLGNYKQLKIVANKEMIKDTEVDNALKMLRRNRAAIKVVDRAAKEGDIVEIDFEGSIDGVQKPEFSSKKYPVIIGDKKLMPGFEDNLIGLRRGDKKTFSIKADKMVDFAVTVLEVKEMMLPEANQDLALSFGAKDISTLKDQIKKSLQERLDEEAEMRADEELTQKLEKEMNIDVPKGLVHEEIHRGIEDLRQYAKKANMTFDQYLSMIKQTEDGLHKALEQSSLKKVKLGLALGQIAKNEQIEIIQEDNILRKIRLHLLSNKREAT